jgi:outer membrane receptor protein involved in Fe transport
VDFQVRNLFDTAYRSYLSRYKTYADNPGRNTIVRVSAAF